MTHEDRDSLVAALQASRKYRDLCPDTLARVAEESLARHRRPKEALKAAKRKLHQIYGAFAEKLDATRLEGLVEAIESSEDVSQREKACRAALELHASTAERMALLTELYPAIFAITGVPGRVLDLACGLHPFALPWMGLPQETHYTAVDINGTLMGYIQRFFGAHGKAGTALCGDLIAMPSYPPGDVAFLFKTMPTLEQQGKGITAQLLAKLEARFAVLSFPAQSLGGRDKGMTAHYEGVVAALIEDFPGGHEKLSFPGETFHILQLQP